MGVLSTPFATCRFCRKMELVYRDGYVNLWKYSVRHYAHAACALEALGEKFFDRIPPHRLEAFPAPIAHKFGLLETLIARVEATKEGGDHAAT